MKTATSVLCFFFLSFTAQSLIAQRAYFDQLTTVNGLPENSAGVILQDHLGFMWIGTANGLVRYDGIKMTVFQNDAKDPYSLKGSRITCLYEDRQGDIWVGCAGGLYRFERATQRFIACMPKGEDAFNNNTSITFIYQDKMGSIWVVVSNTNSRRLIRYNPQSDTWTKYQQRPNNGEGLVYAAVNNMSATGPDQTCFFEDKRGDIWVVTRETGQVTSKAQLHRYDRAKDIFRPYQFNGISAAHPALQYVKLPKIDREGMLWVPTNGNGLYHINPITNDLIAHYRNNPKDSHSLTNDSVRTVYEDRSGLLWISTSYGLDRFDPKTRIFTHFPNIFNNADKARSQVLDAYKETANGHIWFLAVISGIVEYDPKTEQFTYYEGTAKQVGGMGVGKPVSLLVDQSDLIWAGTRGYGLNKQTKMTRFTPFQYPLTKANSVDTTTVITVYETPSEPSVLWLGTNTGLDRYDKKTRQLKHYALNVKVNIASRNDNLIEGVSCITEDVMGRFWVGTSNGLYLMDRKKDNFTRFGQNPSNGNSLNFNFILSVLSARDSSLWIGTANGLNHFNPQTKQFKHYYFADTLYHSDLYRFVKSISNTNRRIVAAWNTSAEKDATQTFKLNQPTTVALVAMGSITNTQKFDFGWIEDINGRKVWEMDYPRTRYAGGAAKRMQIETLQLPAGIYRLQYRGTNSASALNFNLETPTPYNPELWGIQVLRLMTGEADTLNQLSQKWVYTGLSNTRINVLHEDKKGRIWIGTADRLNCYDPKTDDFTVYQDSLKGIVNIKAIYEDPSGKLWLGDYLNGLFLFDPEKGTTERYTTANGLSHNSVTGIVPDDNGELWISTFNGLSRFNPITKRFHTYTGANGLKDLVFRMPPFKSADGDLYFISDQTLYTLAKNQLFDDPYPPKVVLTDIAIFNKKAGIGHNQPLSVDVCIADKITLAHNQNELTISFAALHYNRTAECQYAFKLEPYDKDWIQAGTTRQARYTALPAGTYTFTVKAANADGVWNEQGTSIQVIVLPPWWRTWWAYLLYALAFGLALRAYIQYRSRQLKEENLVLEEKVHQRTTELEKSLTALKATQNQLIQSEKLASLGELTAGIAHEIQNPLNFVNNFSELSVDLAKDLNDEIHKPDIDKEYIEELLTDLTSNQEKINHHGKRASSIVKGMLEHSRASTGVKELTDINKLADEYLRLSYHGMRAKDKDFNADFSTDFDEGLPKIEVIPQDMGRVLLNLINNAFYAVAPQPPKGEPYKPTVIVSTLYVSPLLGGSGGACVIKVKDNGTGMPESVKAKVFQPFFTTKPTGQGTGLGLSLAYDIVTKGHGGTLEVVSTEGMGTEFIISLPYVL